MRESMSKQQVPVNKNDKVILEFEDLTHEGNGVGKVAGYPLFVPNALPGERGEVLVVKVNKNFGFGKLLNLETESVHRVEPPCSVYGKCGGCQLQHMSYEMQLDMKKNQVTSVMSKIAHLPDVPVHPVLGMEDPWRYRNKIQIPVGEKDGELITGFYQKRSHRIIEDMDTCIIQDEVNDRIVPLVRDACQKFGIRAYDEKTHKGALRHIIVRTGQFTGQTMIVLVTKTKTLPHEQKLVEAIQKVDPTIRSIVQNVNTQDTNVIMGKEEKLLWGEPYIYDTIGDLKFGISARSFYQVNPHQTKVLYDKAIEYAQLTGEETVIDAYCGIGSISLCLAEKSKKVYGVEIVEAAIVDAKKNAELNEITNTEFVVGKAEKVIYDWKKSGMKPDVVVVDPPRKGCDQAFLDAVIDMEPKRVVYVSCNPSTLARDLRILEDGGFRTKEVQPVDMFGQTNHVECVAWLEKRV